MKNKKRLYVVSNAHLDTQWNWTIQDTIRDCVKNTMEQNFALFEKYPHYKFNFEGAFRYKLMKEYYPNLYSKVKDYVKEGKWNVAGSEWDASDANVPSSECFMRQILYGNGFFEKEFGKKSSDIFLTDCFGFRWSLPSIAAHMGLNGFSTQKLVWGVGSPIYNEDKTTRRPMPDKDAPRMDLGKWIGPDGNFVIGSFLCGDYTRHFENDSDKRPLHEREEFLKWIDHNEKWTGVPYKMMYYGVGDYGGSPSDASAEYLNNAVADNSDSQPFEVIAASSDQIMNDLTKEQIDSMPSYTGNLLIPHGYGSLTSHTINKRWNRKSELLADSAERLASIAKWLGVSDYPSERIETGWKTFLWHQFHDDLPGTSILNAYGFSYNDLIIAQNILSSELKGSASAVSSVLNTNTDGIPIVVYNPVSSERSDLVSFKTSINAPFIKVFDSENKEVPAQITKSENETYVQFVATVKPVSVSVYHISECTEQSDLGVLKATENSLENQIYRVIIDDNGDICSILDKRNGKELLSSSSGLAIRPDNNTVWPSWEIKYDDISLTPEKITNVISVKIIEEGPASVALRIEKKYKESTFIQIIRLVSNSDVIEVENDVDWLCKRSMLVAEFPFTVNNEFAEFDLGLGADRGGNTDSFPYFQHCVHQWADLTDRNNDYGISVFNDCKYGMEKPNDCSLRLSLIHTPLGQFRPDSAQDFQDMGKNIFRYGIVGHIGRRDIIPVKAASFNQPLIAFSADKHNGDFNDLSFISCSSESVLIKAIKKEENGNNLVVRVQETSGKDQNNISVSLNPVIKTVIETNGYETFKNNVYNSDHSFSFNIGKFEPKTFIIDLENKEKYNKVSFEFIDLDYDVKTTSPDNNPSLGEIADGISIPEELFNEYEYCSGIPFKMGPKNGKNAVVCKGQKIFVGKHKTVNILALSRSGDKVADFYSCGKYVRVKVQDFKENVGTWDMIGRGDNRRIKTDDIAVCYTHTHDLSGNRLYKFAYLFSYNFDVGSDGFIVLPDNNDILIYAATSYDRNTVDTLKPLYDVTDDNPKQSHILKIYKSDGSFTEKSLKKGDKLLLNADEVSGNGLFENWEGNVIITDINCPKAVIIMGDCDSIVKPIYNILGENVILNKKSKSNSDPIDGQISDNMLNGKEDSKWCARFNENDRVLWAEIDLGKEISINKWLVQHCGKFESNRWNTFDFALQYRKTEDDNWAIADSVVANTDDLTIRSFTPVVARYVRLLITLPAYPSGNRQSSVARIYQFHVYAK